MSAIWAGRGSAGWQQVKISRSRSSSAGALGLAELFGYGQQLVARKRALPAGDVISRLCATPGTSDDEIAMMSMFLLFAGHETTVTAIGTGTCCCSPGPPSGGRSPRIPRWSPPR